jgi:deoxyadenosine/deoxycytidine kinase
MGNFNIIVSGNIGASKSSILTVAKSLGHDIIPEPVNMFLDTLKLYYQDKARWGLTLQLDCFISRAILYWDRIQELMDKDGIITFFERDTLEDGVFSKTLHDLGLMKDIEYRKYLLWSKNIRKRLFVPPSAYIIVKTSPKTCMRRVLKRDEPQTDAEKQSDGVFIAYLQALDKNYCNFPHVIREKYGITVPVFELDSESLDYSSDASGQPNNPEDFKKFSNLLSDIVLEIKGEKQISIEKHSELFSIQEELRR